MAIEIKLVNNKRVLVKKCKTERFIELINSNKQFLTLDIVRHSSSENYYRDDKPYDGFSEKIVLNKNLILEFNIY